MNRNQRFVASRFRLLQRVANAPFLGAALSGPLLGLLYGAFSGVLLGTSCRVVAQRTRP
jgi:hypothetical protein